MVVYFVLGGGGNIKIEKLVGYIKDASAKKIGESADILYCLA